VFGRLEPPGRIEEARAEFATIAARLESAYPQTNRGKRALVLGELEARLQTDYTLPSLAMLLIAMGALVLAIGAANAGGLMLARAEAKSRETTIRIALGATAARLLRGSMKQAAWFAGAGATLGVAIAWAAVKSLARVATLPTDFPFAIAPRIDARVLVVSSLALIFATLITGCAPLVKLRRWRDVLVAIEIALASALAATGIWLIANVRSASAIDPGYRVDHVLTLALDPSQIGYTAERTRLFFRQLLEGVRGITGVKNVALAQSAVLGYTRAPAVVEIEREREHRTIWSNAVTPEYFGLMRIAIVAGRGFDDRDATNSPPVAIVNQELARRCGIGLRIRVNGRAMVVIGIAHNAKYFDVQEAPQPYIYLPYAQVSPSRMVLHVETSGDPALLARAVVNQVHQLDPEQPVSEMRPLRDYLEQGSMFGARIGIDAIGAVGACAIALALAGVYGVTSQVVARRRRELGIRIAIGATRRNVITIVLRRGAILAGVGAVVGLAIAWAVTRALKAIAAGTGPGIGSQEIAAAVAIAMVSVVAALVPAYRAARIDPAIALRQE
jgi:cell division protein FtsX